jgi:glutaredoxin
VSKVTVYGADWCGPTSRVREYLTQRGVDFDYVNVEQDPSASEWVKQQNDGKERKPTLEIGDRVLSEPTQSEVDEALEAAGVR